MDITKDKITFIVNGSFREWFGAKLSVKTSVKDYNALKDEKFKEAKAFEVSFARNSFLFFRDKICLQGVLEITGKLL